MKIKGVIALSFEEQASCRPTLEDGGSALSCGIKARLHDLRHSAVTYMLKAGIPIQVVQKIVGHAQLSTTMVYTHILDDLKQKEMTKLKFE